MPAPRSKGRLTRPAAWDSARPWTNPTTSPTHPPKPDADRGRRPLTTADFHAIAQKQILNAVFAVLAETKMDWALVAPFLEAAREVCLGDFEETGRVRLHTMRAEGEAWVEAEEAFLGISVSDRDDGEEWLSETYWLSDIAIADERSRAGARDRRARSSGASPRSTPGWRTTGPPKRPSRPVRLTPRCRRR